MVYELDRRWVVETRWENLDDEHVYGGVLSWRLAWYRPDSSIHRETVGQDVSVFHKLHIKISLIVKTL